MPERSDRNVTSDDDCSNQASPSFSCCSTSGTIIPPLSYGEERPDVTWVVTGDVVYCLHLSPSFAFCTVLLKQSSPVRTTLGLECLDILFTRRDGWDTEPTFAAMRALENCRQVGKLRGGNNSYTITVQGFPERMRPKFKSDLDVIRLHAIHLETPTESFHAQPGLKPLKQAVPVTLTERREKATYRGANDRSRFGKTVEFILQEFGGYQSLVTKPILDIAGGSGALAFELSVRNSLNCVVVDVRPVRLTVQQKQHLKFRERCLESLSAAPPTCTMATNLRNRFTAKSFEQFVTLLDSNSVLESANQTLDETQARLRDLLQTRNCSVMVGLHPDQATDHIIDIGLTLNIAWVVIPCCVFPNLFRRRLLRNGKTVRSYEDLCAYILERDPRIQECVLPFRGRNRAFYWHP